MARRSNVCPPMMIAPAKKIVKKYGVGLTTPYPGRTATKACKKILGEARAQSPKCFTRILRICLGAS